MRFLLLALALLSISSTASAQVDGPGPASPEHDWGWFAFGFGGSVLGRATGAVTANFGRERIVQAGLHGVGSGLFAPAVPSANAAHISYGFSGVDRFSRVAFTLGPAVVWGISDTETDTRYVTGGVVANAQFMVTPLKEFGLGVDVFVNLNPEVPALGAAVTFAFEGNK